MEKVITACCGKYLEESDVKHVLVENEIYGPNSVKSVMSGSHYVGSKWGMSVIAEALGYLQLLTFFNQAELDRYKTLFDASEN